MAKRRRRKITIKNSSLFAFLALISLLSLIEENSAHQLQNPYRYADNQDQQQPTQHQRSHLFNQQKNHYIINQPFLGGSGLSRDEKPALLRSSQLSPTSLVDQENFQEPQISEANLQSPAHQQQKQQQLLTLPLAHDNHQINNNQQHQHNHNSNNKAVLPAARLCASLPGQLARQLRLCKLISHSPSADEVVALGASNGLAECRAQFKHERWNCTHAAGDHQLLTSELAQSIGEPESGFIHAIAAAGIVHSIATACSAGNLSDCACDKSRVGTIAKRDEQPVHWKWGGCSNNIRHGMMFAKHLVELLDAVHQHSRLQQQHHHSSNNNNHNHHHNHQKYHHQQHLLGKRSAGVSRENIFRPPSEAAHQQQRDFCQQNQNISPAKHHELIKSLLASNSLEKHQEFRLAMNMHNNKIGRMVSRIDFI